jgi:hypothetical protein
MLCYRDHDILGVRDKGLLRIEGWSFGFRVYNLGFRVDGQLRDS